MAALAARQITKQDSRKPHASVGTKKHRAARRRGRPRGELDSDDEIEREPVSDESDTDNDNEDDIDSIDSATDDSDTEPASEDAIPRDRAHLPTPRNSKSPDSVGKGKSSSFFAPTGNWSEMVMDETANGPAELPVVDFADFGSEPLLQEKSPRKSKKASKINPPSESRVEPSAQHDTPPTRTTETKRHPHHRKQTLPGHSARQLYQQKLESDPAFIPTIGNFWGHDDRLIDTEFRSLSGWWRGRGGGRGDSRMRGRGEFFGYGRDSDSTAAKDEVPPVDQPWTHDGFEEMKKRDEYRRAQQAAVRHPQSSPKRGGFAGRGRGNFMQGRGRGYTRGFSSPGRSRNNSPFDSAIRFRFVMKPELMWTKQHEAFLYFDTSLKPRPGQGAGFRVRLPGQQLQVIRAPPGPSVPPKSPSKPTTKTESGDNYVVVRLPKPVEKVKEVEAIPSTDKVEEVIESSRVEQDHIAPKPETSLPSTESRTIPEVVGEHTVLSQVEDVSPGLTTLESERQVEPSALPEIPADADIQPAAEPLAERPVLPPLQTTFTPPPPGLPQTISQPSPVYGSPYGYAVPLPPGIAMNAHGMPYELATGRPVYLQPPTMYNPRPIMHSHYPSMQMHPGHMHHHSLSNPSPDFLAHSTSHTPPANGFIDPATGTPIFSFPRQTSRIEIRAPGDTSPAPVKVTKVSPRPPSTLRTSSTIFQPASTRLSTESSEGSGYYIPSTTPSDTPLPSYEPHGSTTVEDSASGTMGMVMHHYPQHYSQQYYYPEPYGYTPYVDISHAGQTYDMYGMDQTPQGTVYY